MAILISQIPMVQKEPTGCIPTNDEPIPQSVEVIDVNGISKIGGVASVVENVSDGSTIPFVTIHMVVGIHHHAALEAIFIGDDPGTEHDICWHVTISKAIDNGVGVPTVEIFIHKTADGVVVDSTSPENIHKVELIQALTFGNKTSIGCARNNDIPIPVSHELDVMRMQVINKKIAQNGIDGIPLPNDTVPDVVGIHHHSTKEENVGNITKGAIHDDSAPCTEAAAIDDSCGYSNVEADTPDENDTLQVDAEPANIHDAIGADKAISLGKKMSIGCDPVDGEPLPVSHEMDSIPVIDGTIFVMAQNADGKPVPESLHGKDDTGKIHYHAAKEAKGLVKGTIHDDMAHIAMAIAEDDPEGGACIWASANGGNMALCEVPNPNNAPMFEFFFQLEFELEFQLEFELEFQLEFAFEKESFKIGDPSVTCAVPVSSRVSITGTTGTSPHGKKSKKEE